MIIYHDERLPSGQRGNRVAGFMLNRTAMAMCPSMVGPHRLGGLPNSIASLCYIDGLAIDKSASRGAGFKHMYSIRRRLGRRAWKLCLNMCQEPNAYTLKKHYCLHQGYLAGNAADTILGGTARRMQVPWQAYHI